MAQEITQSLQYFKSNVLRLPPLVTSNKKKFVSSFVQYGLDGIAEWECLIRTCSLHRQYGRFISRMVVIPVGVSITRTCSE